MCEKSDLCAIPHLQHRPTGVSVNPVIVQNTLQPHTSGQGRISADPDCNIKEVDANLEHNERFVDECYEWHQSTKLVLYKKNCRIFFNKTNSSA